VMLAGLYVVYVIIVAKWKPHLAPPLSAAERVVPLPPLSQALAPRSRNALTGLFGALGDPALHKPQVATQFFISVLPAISIIALLVLMYGAATAPTAAVDTTGLVQSGGAITSVEDAPAGAGGLAEPPQEESGLQEPPKDGADVKEPPAAQASPAQAAPASAVSASVAAKAAEADKDAAATAERLPVPLWYWIVLAVGLAGVVLVCWLMSWQRLEIFKMLLASFFPLAVLIIAVLGSIVFGLATPTEAAAVGALGGLILAGIYRFVSARKSHPDNALVATVKDLGGIIKESSFLTAKTSAMVCWLFVGSSIFSASFALLGGQEIVERWVLSLGLNTVQFMLLSQFIIFILGWPLEWTEIIVIFMPIFIPLLPKFGVDPLFFGLLVALNLQTAFLSPPVAMAAFYLKGVSPPHVTLNQIFAGMMPFMGIQLIALALLYVFPAIGLWLPGLLYK
jgi:TRAP-type mannitol/chloroaromatic compound transport system permease large subunit